MIRTAGSAKEFQTMQVPFKKFPGIPSVADGAGAAVWAESHVAQAASAYPIHPARAMQEAFEDLVGQGARNLWGQPLEILRAESPQDAASICEGFALTGGRAVSFASGQALPAMTETLRTIAGKRLPMVFHVGARALQSQALATRTGHDDILSVADCGWGIVFAKDAQEVADLALICRRAAEYAETPFFVVQDAYATTHQIQDLLLPEPDLMRLFVGEPGAKLLNYFNPRRPAMVSPVQEEGDYAAGRKAQREYLGRAASALQASIEEFARLTGRLHGGVEGYRLDGAEHVLVGSGSMMDDARRAVDALRGRGVAAGLVTVRAFRPFPLEALRTLLAAAVTVTVLERTDVPLAPANPLTLAVASALGVSPGQKAPGRTVLFTATVGLGATRVGQDEFISAAENAVAAVTSAASLARPGGLPPSFVEQKSVPVEASPAAPAPTGLALLRAGGSGAANANRLVAAVSRSLFGVRVDAQGDAGTEKVGKPLALRLAAAPAGGPRPSAAETPAKLLIVDSAGLFHAGDPLAMVADGGVVFCPFAGSLEELWRMLPAKLRRQVQDRGIRLAGLDRKRVPSPAVSTHSVGSWGDLVALGAWLRISSFLKESKLAEQEVYHRMFECLGRLCPAATDAQVDASYEVVKNAYLSMLRFAVPEEKVEVAENTALPVVGAPAKPANGKPGLGGATVDLDDSFCEQIIGTGACPNRASATASMERASAIPAAELVRSLRHDAAEIPRIDMERCVGCMECVALCPDVAIVGRVVEAEDMNRVLSGIADPGERALMAGAFGRTRRYWESFEERKEPGGMLALFVDPDRCKGCGECVDACGINEAITMSPKTDVDLASYDRAMAIYRSLPDTPERFLSERSLGDMLLSSRAQLTVGGTSSCAGCGQSTAVRLMLSSTGFQYGAENVGVVAAAGCDSVYGAVFPYNPYRVPWTNTLSGNAPADALGIRRSWDREGHTGRKLWVLGSMENFGGAGLSALTALLAAGEDINVLVLDSQVFECESRRIHGAAFHAEGRASAGKRQELDLRPTPDLAQIAMAFPGVLVAQTTASHLNHFHRAIRAANEYAGPSVVICYATCMAEDGVSEEKAMAQAKLAVESRTFPLLMLDPRKGEYLRDRLSLSGNPSPQQDWYVPGRESEPLDFIRFAATEERFAPYFDDKGAPGEALRQANENRLANWRRLQELAGLR